MECPLVLVEVELEVLELVVQVAQAAVEVVHPRQLLVAQFHRLHFLQR